MIFITGGAYQGKKEYALREFGFSENDIADGSMCSSQDILDSLCIVNYHNFVKRFIESGNNAIEFTKRLCSENKNAVIIMNEIGCGIVPIEKNERVWRENVGKCGCIIAKNSERVIRIINSIAVVIS